MWKRGGEILRNLATTFARADNMLSAQTCKLLGAGRYPGIKMRYYSKRTNTFTAVAADGRAVKIEEYTNYLEEETGSGVVASQLERELLANGATVKQIGDGLYTVGVHGLVVRRESRVQS